MRTPKENKQKPRDRTPKSTAGTIPKATLKAVWLKTKEQTRTAAHENDTNPRQQETIDLAGSAAEQAAAFVRRQGQKLAETQARQHHQKEAAARAHAAGERGVSPKQAEYGTLPDAAQRLRRGADLPRQRAKEKAITAKTAPRDIRGVTQSQRQLRTAANQTVRSVTTQAQMQTHTRQVKLAIQKAVANTRKTVAAVRSAIRNFLADLHSLVVAIATGISVALGIVIVISLVAFVSGSAYGIFFAANAPNAASVTVREAVETLTAEYRDRLEEISETVQHDRQDITANDDVYYIRWQDVLAVFSSYVAGSEQGAPVAALTENQVLMNQHKVQVFHDVVKMIKKPRVIQAQNLYSYRVVAQSSPFSGALAMQKVSRSKTVFSDAFKEYNDPYKFLQVLKGKDIPASEYYKYFVNITYEVFNQYGSPASGGERSEYNLLQELSDGVKNSILILDEPESSFDNIFLRDGVDSLLKDISKTIPEIIATHNNTIGVSVHPDYIVYACKEVLSDGKLEYHLYSGYPSSEDLVDLKGNHISRKSVLLDCLEAGEAAYMDRRNSYEILNG